MEHLTRFLRVFFIIYFCFRIFKSITSLALTAVIYVTKFLSIQVTAAIMYYLAYRLISYEPSSSRSPLTYHLLLLAIFSMDTLQHTSMFYFLQICVLQFLE